MRILNTALLIFSLIISCQTLSAQNTDQRLYDIIDEVSAGQLENSIQTLVNFGTRNTFSDTTSNTRGIGAARRWIKTEFDEISEKCNSCLEVFYQKKLVTPEDGDRVPKKAYVVNVIAIQRGTENPNNYIMMSGDIDSRASNTMDFTTDAPGANDNASGMAGTIEAARVLSNYSFKNSIVYVGFLGKNKVYLAESFWPNMLKKTTGISSGFLITI